MGLMREAQDRATVENRPMVEPLQQILELDNTQFLEALGQRVGLPVVSMASINSMVAAMDLMSFPDMLRHECLLLRDTEGQVNLIVSDPFDQKLRQWADANLDFAYSKCLSHRSDITAYLTRQEKGLRAMESLGGGQGGSVPLQDESVEELSFRTISEDASPVIKFVNSTLFDALRAGASDIHLESTSAGMVIKYRIDGVLSTVGSVATSDLAEQTISRIKVMSELDISERRVPQDGRFRVSLQARLIDLRVSIIPSIHGEDAVLRILDKQSLSDQMKGLQLTTLGFDEDVAAVLRGLAAEPYGMMLVTGPTGSGKTTTLYAAISEINTGAEKIVTIEDPVEYQLPGVLQIPVNEKKGLTFARGLRSILRHDPDKIMVGEIRDSETAQIAIQSALTGHLVFTTVHANNVFDVIGRFMHMGVDMYSLVSALNGVLAQRLLRVNCKHCEDDDYPAPDLLKASGLHEDDVAGWRFRAGRGCGHCRGSGFKGRKAIAEVLSLNDEIRELIVARAPIRQLKKAAQSNGTRLLRESALDLVRRGETTLSEINRVTFIA
ncbi:general secretion pathway protein GspE [Rhodoferax lacus]|uniref:General secretion pathway protein GspE n=2 Tax=Rhodoferax lacus TaxID=2184758 RepID=A0A3E1RI78_9BURK|nr:general secretion pathway protein GspE [Rhodoferax lacus]